MIVGLGTDIIEIARVRNSLARFAAKEAAAKALGTGISRGVSWLEIEIRRAPGHPPTLHFSNRALHHAQRLGVARASISLTHARDSAFAIVILES